MAIFKNIGGLGHKFPVEVKELRFPIIFLHTHEHAHGNLVFIDGFSKAKYKDDVTSYFPCSWYLDEQGNTVEYEYCDKKIDYSEKEIFSRLKQLKALDYDCYGITVRPIYNVDEIETDDGHIFVDKEESIQRSGGSETAINFDVQSRCYVRHECHARGGRHYHVSVYH